MSDNTTTEQITCCIRCIDGVLRVRKDDKFHFTQLDLVEMINSLPCEEPPLFPSTGGSFDIPVDQMTHILNENSRYTATPSEIERELSCISWYTTESRTDLIRKYNMRSYDTMNIEKLIGVCTVLGIDKTALILCKIESFEYEQRRRDEYISFFNEKKLEHKNNTLEN